MSRTGLNNSSFGSRNTPNASSSSSSQLGVRRRPRATDITITPSHSTPYNSAVLREQLAEDWSVNANSIRRLREALGSIGAEDTSSRIASLSECTFIDFFCNLLTGSILSTQHCKYRPPHLTS